MVLRFDFQIRRHPTFSTYVCPDHNLWNVNGPMLLSKGIIPTGQFTNLDPDRDIPNANVVRGCTSIKHVHRVLLYSGSNSTCCAVCYEMETSLFSSDLEKSNNQEKQRNWSAIINCFYSHLIHFN